MALLGPPSKPTLLDPLHRDLRSADPANKQSYLDLSQHRQSPSPSLDGHLLAQPLNIDLYNSMASSNPKPILQKFESRPESAVTTRERASTPRLYQNPQPQ